MSKSMISVWAAAGCGLAMVLAAQQQTARSAPRRPAAAKAAAAVGAKSTATGTTDSADGSDITLGLKLGPGRPIRPLTEEEFVLPNGLRASVSENHELPLVHIYVVIPAAASADPPEKAGLSEVSAHVIRSGGTAALTAGAFQERLVQWGAQLESSAAETYTLFSVTAPSAVFNDVLPVLRDLLVAPRLDPEAVDSVLGQMHESIGQRNGNPTGGLTRLFRQKLYESGSPYARQSSYETVDSISRSDIEAFHRRWYLPAKSVLAIDGDIAPSAAKAKVEELFATWAQPSSTPTEPSAPGDSRKLPAGAAILFADRDDLRAAGFVMGHRAGRAADEDFAAMQLVCELLAGNPEGRLQARVRSAGGWRAEWAASWEAGIARPGEFAVRSTLEAAYTTQAIGMVKEEIAKIREGNVTELEVERLRARLAARLAVRYQSSTEQSRERAIARFHGLPPDLLPRTYQAMVTLTKADVVRAAARNLPPEYVVAVAGNSKLFDKQLSALGGKVEPAELLTQTTRTVKAQVDAASLERGKVTIAKMREALGGHPKLKAVRDMSIRTEGSSLQGDRMVSVKLWDRWLEGDVYRQDQDYGVRQMSVFYDGKLAWVGVRGSVAPMPPTLIPQIRNEMFRFPFRLALSDEMPNRQVADIGGNVLQITEGEARSIRIYLDPATWLPQRTVYRVDYGNGVTIAAEESLSGWQDFDGIKWPTKISSRKNGRRSDEFTVVEAKFNSGLKRAELEQKP